jgi:hypothetical protein
LGRVFNIDRRGDPLWEALTSTGLKTPQALNDVPRTIFDDPQDHHFYDQIAWFEENCSKSVLTLDFASAGSFDFVPLLQGGLTTTALSWRISDHYPLWVEFSGQGLRLKLARACGSISETFSVAAGADARSRPLRREARRVRIHHRPEPDDCGNPRCAAQKRKKPDPR